MAYHQQQRGVATRSMALHQKRGFRGGFQVEYRGGCIKGKVGWTLCNALFITNKAGVYHE